LKLVVLMPRNNEDTTSTRPASVRTDSQAKRATLAKIERVESQVETGTKSFMTKAQLIVEKDVQMNLPRADLRGMSLRQVKDEKTICKYIGISYVTPMEREAFPVVSRKWKSTRNGDGSYTTDVNIPGVTLPYGRRIKGRKEAGQLASSRSSCGKTLPCSTASEWKS
jgi:hypothetical protein